MKFNKVLGLQKQNLATFFGISEPQMKDKKFVTFSATIPSDLCKGFFLRLTLFEAYRGMQDTFHGTLVYRGNQVVCHHHLIFGRQFIMYQICLK